VNQKQREKRNAVPNREVTRRHFFDVPRFTKK